MTTTPTASPELPDLDKLEALARAATPGEWKAMPHGRVVGGPLRHYVNGSAKAQIASFGVTFHEQAPEDEPERQQANADFAAAANPEQVLALIALARRAQPEGEAPQADVHKLDAAMSLLRVAAECDVDKISPAKLRNQVRESVADAAGRNGEGEEYIFADVYGQLTEMLEPWMFRDGRDPSECPLPASVTESVEMLLEYFNRPAATLSPLCGAQHAESGKEAYQVFSHDSGEWYGVDKAQYDRAHDSCRRVLAAQQAAAPVNSVEFDGIKTSAPGTPEAPADRHPVQPLIEDEHGRARFKENAIVRHLSEGKLNELAALGFPEADWEQFAQLIGYSLDGFGTLSYVTDETYGRAATQPVLQRAAQLDGSQEGSESNG